MQGPLGLMDGGQHDTAFPSSGHTHLLILSLVVDRSRGS